MTRQEAGIKRHGGFTLVELSVVIVIIGILAAFAVPKFRKAVERSKAGEAFNYLSSVRASQERYFARESSYAENLGNLDINMPPPKYFSVATIVGPDITGDTDGLENGWNLALTRSGSASGYGSYTVVFNQDGFIQNSVSIPGVSNIINDISPMSSQ